MGFKARRRTRVRRTVLAVSLTIAIFASLFIWIVRPTYRQPPEPEFPVAASRAEAVLQDLAYLRVLAAYDRSFTKQTRAEFERRVALLEARAGDLDPAALEMGVAWAFAAAENAHSNARSAVRGLALNSLPLRLLWFNEGLFVIKADIGHQQLLGARVLAEGGIPVDQLAQELRRYTGGLPQFAFQFTAFLLESPQAMHAAGYLREPGEASLLFETDAGQFERVIAAGPQPVVMNADDARPIRDLSPVPRPNDDRRWMHVLDGKSLPLYLQNVDRPYWHTTLVDPKALYVQINTTRSMGKQSLPDFLAGRLIDIRRDAPSAVIIDLRFNTGGDYSLATEFTGSLPETMSPGSRLFVITSRSTFSAAITTAVHLKAYARHRPYTVYFVGEEPAESLQYWGEGKRLKLPNSQIAVRYASALHRHSGPCSIREVRECFLLDYLYPGAAVSSYKPDLPADLTFADYLALRDPAMERIARLLGQSDR